MIDFEKIIYKNLLASGNHPIEISLNKNKRTLIVGHNGAGKSTILSALTFCLFGKDFRGLTQKNIINTINNKGLYTECHFSSHGNKYIVKRGLKPNIFEIYKNGELKKIEGSSKQYQNYLENEVLKRNLSTFKQIDILGSNNYTPFMRLDTKDRREMIENLVSLSIFSNMKERLKEKVSENKVNISTNKSSIETKKEEIDMLKNLLLNAKKKKQDNEEKLKLACKELEQESEELKKKIVSLEQSRDKLNVALEKKPEVEQQKNDNSINIKNEIFIYTQFTEDLKFFESNNTCPTCTQEIDDSLKSNKITEISNKITEKHDVLKDLKQNKSKLATSLQNIEKIEQMKQKVEKDIKTIYDTIDKNDYKIKSIISQMEDVDKDTGNIDDIEAQISKSEKAVEKIRKELDECLANTNTYNIANLMLKDDGLKASIIRKYIPYINTKINEYLEAMNFYVQFELDENFNETIKSRYRDVFTYQNFSEGEKQRIDLAILFAWRDVAKARNTLASNLLILDETFDSSLDGGGVDDLINILYKFKDNNVIVISHKEAMFEKFQTVLKFEKKNNFSVMEEIKS